MRNNLVLLSLLASLGATSGCTQVECGDGTIERDGTCEPATAGAPTVCGPNTVFVANQCLPKYDPTTCDPSTSEPVLDPNTGITVCVGMGGTPMCGIPLSCAAPAANKLTVCGQLYDFETGQEFRGAATGAKCATTTTSGPCALQILAFDALVYGQDQTKGNVTPTGQNDVYIDDCGRYRVSNIDTNGTGPFIGIGFTEAGKPPQQPLANLTVTATTGVATSKPPSRLVTNFEAFIVKPSTITSWQTTSGNAVQLSNGIYVGLFRSHKVGNGDLTAKQQGVTFTKSGNPIPNQDFYSAAALTSNLSIDTAASSTGMNGTGWLNGTAVTDNVVYSGTGGLGSSHCQWETHAAANIANIVFFQIFRKTDVTLDPTPCAD